MKAVGVLIIGLGLLMIVIGVQGTQSQVLADLKGINPKLRNLTGTSNAGTTGNAQAGPLNPGPVSGTSGLVSNA